MYSYSNRHKPTSLYILLIFFVHIVFSFSLKSQTYQVKGKVMQAHSNHSLPFVCITINEGENHAFTDINGNFDLTSSKPIDKLQFSTHEHRSLQFSFEGGQRDSLIVALPWNELFVFEDSTSNATRQLMMKVIEAKQLHHPENYSHFTYKTYNKFVFTSDHPEKVRNEFQRILDKINFINAQIKEIPEQHHLLLIESTTQRKFLDALNQLETINASRISGVDHPTVFTTNSQTQPFSFYKDILNIAGQNFYSPLVDNAFRWYRFSLTDIIQLGNESLYMVKFNPRSKQRIEFLKGYLYINANDYALRFVDAEPNIQKGVEIVFAQSNQLNTNGKWFPNQTRTAIYKDAQLGGKLEFDVINTTSVYDVAFGIDSLNKRDFDEILLKYHEENKEESESYWVDARKEPFTKKDAATYVFYDSVGHIKNFDRLIRLGEGIYYGELPVRKVNFDLPKTINFNRFEGLRLGLGLHTNDRLVDWWQIGGYFGYGLKDDILKYGVHTKFLLHKGWDMNLSLAHSKDVFEAGRTDYSFNQKQFPNENIRNIQILIMDKETRNELAFESRIYNYLLLKAHIVKTAIQPQYEYIFQDRLERQFDFGEVGVGIKFAYGEKYIQSTHRKISLGTNYPILWVQFNRGINGLLGGEFDYRRLDIKLQKAFKFIGFGTSYLQVNLGKVDGKVPYSRLYNGRGSFRTFSAIAHSSFETMDYNEFLSDQHISIFYLHNFGKIHIRKLKKQPSFEMSHNMGFGSLRNPEDHSFPFKTMEKGYFESGVFLNNILVLKGFGLQTGLGAGAFLRYGAYSHNNFNENLLFKLAVDFQL